MNDSMMGDGGGSLLVRTVAVTVLVIGFFAIATGVVPVRCWITGTCGSAKTEQAAAALPAKAAPKPVPEAPKVEPAAAKAAPTLTSNDVISGSFAQLKVELNPPTRLPATTASAQVAATAPQPPAATTVTNPDTGLNKRVVRAVTVHADGTPEAPGAVAQAYASAPPATPAPPAVDAAARIGAGQRPAPEAQTVADLSPDSAKAAPAAKASTAAKAGTGTAEVIGSGANVRTAPSNTGKVLFALRAGERVAILGSQRGWMEIKDRQGRTGWMYGDALKRS